MLATDDVLSRFVDWAAAPGLSLYPAQEEAIHELLADKHVVLSTPTGSGKSLVAMAIHDQQAHGSRGGAKDRALRHISGVHPSGS